MKNENEEQEQRDSFIAIHVLLYSSNGLVLKEFYMRRGYTQNSFKFEHNKILIREPRYYWSNRKVYLFYFHISIFKFLILLLNKEQKRIIIQEIVLLLSRFKIIKEQRTEQETLIKTERTRMKKRE